MSTEQTRKVLITGIDDCAISLKQIVNGKLLTANLIKFAKAGGYSEFYACTHRSVGNYQENILGAVSKVSAQLKLIDEKTSEGIPKLQAYQIHCQPKREPLFEIDHLTHPFTHKVIQHLEEETELKCAAVSTPHDFIRNRQCGDGYNQVIKPIEQQVIANGYDFACYAEAVEQCKVAGRATKNSQLLQIIAHARRSYPKDNLIFDFVDDSVSICNNALQLNLPIDVTFHVYAY